MKFNFLAFLMLFVLVPAAWSQTSAELMEKLKSSDNNIRREALNGLRDKKFVNDETLIEPLLKVVVMDKDFILQERAAEILAKHKSPAALNGLINVLDNASAHAGHQAAAYGLSESNDQRAIEPLKKVLNHRQERVRKYAVVGLSPYVKKDQSISEAFLERAKADSDFIVRERAADALAKDADENMINRMIGALKDNKIAGRGEIASALGDAKKSNAIPALIDFLKTAQKDDQKDAVKALINFQDSRIIAPFIEVAQRPGVDSIAREYSVEYLAKSGDVRARELMMSILKNPKERNRMKQYAALGLRESGEMSALHELIALLGSDDKYTRMESLKTIQAILKRNPRLESQMHESLQCLPAVTQGASTAKPEAMYLFDVLFFGGLPIFTVASSGKVDQFEAVDAATIKSLQDLVDGYLS